MHTSAENNYNKFLEKYVSKNTFLRVLDVGSFDVNGTLKPHTVKHISECNYVGLDICEGPNVDIVSSSLNIPFDDNYFDLVISSSCFEHDEMFWNSFEEMVRVTKQDGLIYVCAPSSGDYHGNPGDCWRFYKDSWNALAKWSKDVVLLESYIDKTDKTWNDSIGIYQKTKTTTKIQINVDTIQKGTFNFTYNNVQCLKNPFDYALYQKIIFDIKPDLIIEIGTNLGGSTLYLADLMNIIGTGIVHTIDVNKNADDKVYSHPRIKTYHNGWQEYNINTIQEFEKILIIDDASHMYEDVLKVLNKFSSLITLGSYFIVEDGIIDELRLSEQYNGGPLKAIKDFLANHPEFEIDKELCNFFGTNSTFNINGYLKRIL